MKILLTGSAGFIGTAIASALEADGDEVVRVDLMLPQAHGSSAAPDGTHQLDVRESASDADGAWARLLDGVDAVCHQAAVVGAGVTVGRPAGLRLPQRPRHRRSCSPRCTTPTCDRLVVASSMVVYGEGRYTCETHGDQVPGPRAVDALDAGDFENHCPHCGATLGWSLVDETARLDPRSSYAASKLAQEHYTSAWVRQADAAAVALRYHNVYGPGMPRDTPYSGVAAMFRSSLERGEAPRVYEDGAQMRDFVHVADVARANVLALRAVVGEAPGHYAAYNVASGHPVSILDVAQRVAQGTGSGADLAPEVTGGYRLGDVRHIVASPERAREALGFSAEILPEEGLPAFATVPLRA